MKALAFVPLPPPAAGPEIATQALLDVLPLPPDCQLKVVKTNVRTSNEKKGVFDRQGIWRASRSLGNLFWACLCFRPHKVYLLINPSNAGFLRDAAAIFIAKLFFCRVIGHYHGSRFHYFYQAAPVWYRFLIRRGLKRVDKMIVQAECLKSVFSGLVPESKISVLYNGVPDLCLKRGGAAVKMRKERKKDFVTFLFLNHISFTKGFYDLMSAYRQLLEEGKKVRLLVAGDFMLNPKTQAEFLEEPHRRFYLGRYPQIHREMLDFVRDNPAAGVEYHGVVSGESKHLLFERADVFVLPSHTEGFPNVILEAMAFGLGLIATPVGALPEVLREPDHALFTQKGNAASLAGRMSRLIVEPSLFSRMGTNNRETVVSQFPMQKAGQKFTQLVFE